jgi:hypothetical protein
MKILLLRIFIFAAQILTILGVSGCVSTSSSGDSQFDAERKALNSAGVPNIMFSSSGQLLNFTYVSYPRSTHLKLVGKNLFFDDSPLDFIWCDENEYHFYKRSLNSQVTFSIDKSKGVVAMSETGGLFFRNWVSKTSASDFTLWAQYFIDLGYTPARLGFVPEVKFIDGTKTQLKSDDRNVFTVEKVGGVVLWDNEPVALSVITTESNLLAVELRKKESTFWLFGGGNFQVIVEGTVKTSFVGSSRPPTGSTITGEVPAPYADLYPALKTLAQNRR